VVFEIPALTPTVVIGAALIDSINPCAFAILVFLLLSLAAAGNRRRILFVGGSYIAAIFFFHLLVGIGLFSAIAFSGFSRAFSLIGAAIAIVLGLVTILDVFRNRDTFLLSVPASKKGIIGRYVEKLSVPAAFILGIFAGLFGFSCTGGIYIGILGLMSRNLTMLAGLPWLILYNIIFILPLVLVVLLVYYGFSPRLLENWHAGNKRIFRMIIGLAMLAIGCIIVSGWLG
jgi:cytochrome c biogenesis protein CcdA